MKFLVCLLGVFLSVWGSAADWPQFRGPNRDGHSPEKGIARSWGADGPKEIWRTPIGAGYSTISIVGDRLYTLDSDEENEYALCADTKTGKTIWRVPVNPLFTNNFGNGPRAAPTVDGDTVFVLGSRGVLKALDTATGAERWQVDFTAKYQSKIPRWAFCGAPLVLGEMVVVEVNGAETAIVALNKKTGEQKWQGGPGQHVYSSPLSLTFGGVPQILYLTKEHLVSVDHEGKELWQTPFMPRLDITPAIPVFVAPDLIFLSASYDTGAKVVRMQPGPPLAVDDVWEIRTAMRNHFNSSVAVGDKLYGFDKAIFKCIDAATGDTRWQKRGFGKGSLIAADGLLIVLGERGRLALFKINAEEPEQLAVHSVLSGRCWTSPVLANGRVYVRNNTEMVALDLKGGNK